MTARNFCLSTAAAVSLTCAAAISPLLLPAQVAAQDNPTMSNVIPDGGNYSIQGKLSALDPATLTLTLTPQNAEPMPMTVRPGVDLSEVSVGDVANVHYTRSVVFVIGSPNVSVANVPASSTVGEVARTPGGIGPNAATVVGRVVKINSPSSFDVVNANGGAIYTIQVSNPNREPIVGMLKVGDSVTANVSPLIVTSIAKCGLFGKGLFGC